MATLAQRKLKRKTKRVERRAVRLTLTNVPDAVGHSMALPDPPDFGPLRFSPEQQAANPSEPMTRVVKDLCRVGSWKSGFDENGRATFENFNIPKLATIAANAKAMMSHGHAINLGKNHGDKDLAIATDDLISPLDDVILANGVLWGSSYVTPEQAAYLRNPARKVSVGLWRDYQSGDGQVYPGLTMLHVAVTDRPVVTGQGRFLALQNYVSLDEQRITLSNPEGHNQYTGKGAAHTLATHLTSEKLHDPSEFRKQYSSLSDGEQKAARKELHSRGLLHPVDAKKKVMTAGAVIDSARGQFSAAKSEHESRATNRHVPFSASARGQVMAAGPVTGHALKHQILQYVADHGPVSLASMSNGSGKVLSDMHADLGHHGSSSPKHPVNAAAKELVDSGHLQHDATSFSGALHATGKVLAVQSEADNLKRAKITKPGFEGTYTKKPTNIGDNHAWHNDATPDSMPLPHATVAKWAGEGHVSAHDSAAVATARTAGGQDQAVVNVPLAKRGNIDAQIDRYKADQSKAARVKEKAGRAEDKVHKAHAEKLFAEHGPELVKRTAAKSGKPEKEVHQFVSRMIKTNPEKAKTLLERFAGEQSQRAAAVETPKEWGLRKPEIRKVQKRLFANRNRAAEFRAQFAGADPQAIALGTWEEAAHKRDHGEFASKGGAAEDYSKPRPKPKIQKPPKPPKAPKKTTVKKSAGKKPAEHDEKTLAGKAATAAGYGAAGAAGAGAARAAGRGVAKSGAKTAGMAGKIGVKVAQVGARIASMAAQRSAKTGGAIAKTTAKAVVKGGTKAGAQRAVQVSGRVAGVVAKAGVRGIARAAVRKTLKFSNSNIMPTAILLAQTLEQGGSLMDPKTLSALNAILAAVGINPIPAETTPEELPALLQGIALALGHSEPDGDEGDEDESDTDSVDDGTADATGANAGPPPQPAATMSNVLKAVDSRIAAANQPILAALGELTALAKGKAADVIDTAEQAYLKFRNALAKGGVPEVVLAKKDPIAKAAGWNTEILEGLHPTIKMSNLVSAAGAKTEPDPMASAAVEMESNDVVAERLKARGIDPALMPKA